RGGGAGRKTVRGIDLAGGARLRAGRDGRKRDDRRRMGLLRLSLEKKQRKRWVLVGGSMGDDTYEITAKEHNSFKTGLQGMEISGRISVFPRAFHVTSSKLSFFVVAHLQGFTERSRGSLRMSLGSYVYSFLDEHFKTDKEKLRVLAYTDVGLILIGFKSSPTYYVANAISRQCVKIPPRPLRPLGQEEENYNPGLVTRIPSP
ncbi:hypothetical protein F2Q70_00005582, partial [Brassica cretica]